MYSDRRGTDKTTRIKPSRQKTPGQIKAPGQKPSRTIEREFVQRDFVRIFCTRPTKNGGGPRCVTYFWGVPGCVTKCDMGEGGSKLAMNSVAYFMDGPLKVPTWRLERESNPRPFGREATNLSMSHHAPQFDAEMILNGFRCSDGMIQHKTLAVYNLVL